MNSGIEHRRTAPYYSTISRIIKLAFTIAGLVFETALCQAKEVAIDPMPLQKTSFTENRGQWPSNILYRTRSGGITAWFGQDKVYYQIIRTTVENQRPHLAPDAQNSDTVEYERIDFSFVGAKPDAEVCGEQMQACRSNYFLGNDSSRWATNVPMFSEVRYSGIYDGIDVAYYYKSGLLEHDFVIAPNADPSQIRIQVTGSQGLAISDDGALSVRTKLALLRFKLPSIYQIIDSQRKAVEAHFALLNDSEYTIEIGSGYQKCFALTIDPVLIFSSFLGGSAGDEGGRAIATDHEGNAIVTGKTPSTDFPLLNAWHKEYAHGLHDVFVAKFSPAGQPIFSTYLGGGYDDRGNGIVTDHQGSIYVGGMTRSFDFPMVFPVNDQNDTTGDPFQASNAFLFKLSSTGDWVEFSTLWGGSGYDEAWDVGVNYAGEVYIGGTTRSPYFPCVNCIDSVNHGIQNSFVAKFSGDGQSVLYSTSFGGDFSDGEFGGGFSVDSAGYAYVVGCTAGHNFPLVRPIGTLDGWQYHGYVVKISPEGSAYTFSTILGGHEFDCALDVAVDNLGFIYVVGYTASAGFPIFNAFDSLLGAYCDGFLTKLAPDGQSIVYSTFFGGTGWAANDDDIIYGVAVDSKGSAYVAGTTTSWDVPMVNPIQSKHKGSYTTGFVAKFSPSGKQLVYSSYLGGSNGDSCKAIAVDRSGNAFVTGTTMSNDFPLVHPSDQTFGGRTEVLLCEIGEVSTSLEDDEVQALPTLTMLQQNHPNPFNPTTTIEFDLPHRSDVQLEIFNVLGQKVRTLVNDSRAAGHYAVEWDSQGDRNVIVSSGVYFYRLTAGTEVLSKKMLLLK